VWVWKMSREMTKRKTARKKSQGVNSVQTSETGLDVIDEPKGKRIEPVSLLVIT